MASSSSCQYDVFLSFRGEDTRDNFTSHLYAALCRKKIKTFIDDEGLRLGCDISPTLLKVIEGSKISIIIFSKHYASSKWCLNELVKILQCHQMNGQIVVPVFYHVDPSDVRKQSGSFGDAFVNHEKHFKDMPEKVMNWRVVLTQASNLSGWASKEIRSEAKLVGLIVGDILKKLENVTTSTYFGGFVGLNSRIEKIKSLLCIGSLDYRIVGIWGMGGIGKTTIAGVIFNQNLRKFEGKCFLANVREESEKGGGLVYLRERVLSGLLEENIKIGTPELPEYIRRRLQQMKVLIVLDDVNKFSQLQYLIGGLERCGLGSRIIITTRDRRVLDNFGVCNTNIYQVRRLEYHNALELFCNCAFKEKHCPSDLLVFSEHVLKYADGNPLALRVLGSFFLQKSKLDWEKTLEHLNKIYVLDIYDVLKISYDDLQPEVKSIFLDIACFFVGEDREFVTRILDDPNIPHYGMNVLSDKSLIAISWSNKLQMHDLLQKMGREIVRQECVKEPNKRSRLWYHEDVYRVLKRNKGTNTIEGIFLDLSKITRDIHLDSRVFEKMPNLRLLKFYVPEYDGVPIMSSKVYLDQGLAYLPEELRYLHWHEYPLKTFPLDFEIENVIELNLPYSKVEQLWEGEKDALKLLSMDLHHSQCLIRIPKPSQIPNIQMINLSNCQSLSCFPTFHNLHNLSSPSLLSGLSTLVELNLSECALMEIPQDIGCLSSLRLLNLSGNKFKSLPASIGSLSSLGILDLYGNNLESLPASIGCLFSLWSLDLCRNKLESLPISIGSLSSLKRLDLSENNFEGLPMSMKKLSRLQYLYLCNCNMLQSLPELPMSLTDLYARNCKRLRSLPKVPSCPEELDISILEILSKQSGQGSYDPMVMDFMFTNCLKLNENAINILQDSQRIFQSMVIASLRLIKETHIGSVAPTLCLPGSKIPDWISNQSLFNSVTIQLHCGNRNFIGFIVCVVIGGLDASYDLTFLRCYYCFEIITPSETKHVQKDSILEVDDHDFFDSEHILLRFCPCWDVGLPNGDHHTTVSFQLSLLSHHVDELVTLRHDLRCCGVSPAYLNSSETKSTTLALKFAASSQEGRIYDAVMRRRNSDEKELAPSPKRICKEELEPSSKSN